MSDFQYRCHQMLDQEHLILSGAYESIDNHLVTFETIS